MKVDPNTLTHIELVWQLALHTEVKAVASKSIGLLANSFLAVHRDPAEERKGNALDSSGICQDFIDQIF